MPIKDFISKVFREGINYDTSGFYRALRSLLPREEKVLRMRFGIDEEKHTVIEIAKDFEVSRTRIYQIEHKAINKMKCSTKRRKEYIL